MLEAMLGCLGCALYSCIVAYNSSVTSNDVNLSAYCHLLALSQIPSVKPLWRGSKTNWFVEFGKGEALGLETLLDSH